MNRQEQEDNKGVGVGGHVLFFKHSPWREDRGETFTGQTPLEWESSALCVLLLGCTSVHDGGQELGPRGQPDGHFLLFAVLRTFSKATTGFDKC